jgi:23S rRNA (uracil1939-C5)-methyltransferase
LPRQRALEQALKGVGVQNTLWKTVNGTRLVFGREHLTDSLCGLSFQVSADAFLQVNPRQAERLYQLAGDMAGLTGMETVVDLYCGTGTIGLTMASRASKVVGVELNRNAIADATANAAANHIDNAEFFCGDAQSGFAHLMEQGFNPKAGDEGSFLRLIM